MDAESSFKRKIIHVDTIAGPWFSLGLHVDFQHRYIDVHFIWWIITLFAIFPQPLEADLEWALGRIEELERKE